jgi:hypothetical protein
VNQPTASPIAPSSNFEPEANKRGPNRFQDFDAEMQAMDFGAMAQRRSNKAPPGQGSWHLALRAFRPKVPARCAFGETQGSADRPGVMAFRNVEKE